MDIYRKMLVRYRYRKREQKTAAGDRADGEDMQMRRITVEAEGERVRVMLDGQEIQNVQGFKIEYISGSPVWVSVACAMGAQTKRKETPLS